MTKTLEELLAGCESEPLHRSGAIQPFGALVRVDATTGRVTHASRNLDAFTGVGAEAVVGRALDDLGWLPAGAVARVAATPGKPAVVAVTIGAEARLLSATVVGSEGGVLVEIELRAPGDADAVWRRHGRALHVAPPFEQLAEHHGRLVAALREITGFDRVMVYRFHEDWTGEVVAESAVPDLGSYLGLRFPASDIPAIARNLYLVNPTRLIPDVDAAPVPILGASAEPPDLTYSTLRSVSPVHLEYLRNMRVRGSFSVPIRMGGRLWGLVACHHRAPRALSPEQRGFAARAASVHAAAVTSSLASHRLQVVDSLDRRLGALVHDVAREGGVAATLDLRGDALLRLLDGDGLAVRVREISRTVGQVPAPPDLDALDRWFLARTTEPVFVTDHLEGELRDAPGLAAVVSGVLAVKWRIARRAWGRCYWLRRPQVEHVTWAGDPRKRVVEDAGATRLSPRASFEAWVETKTGYARPFTNEERMTAARFRNMIAQVWV